jgi:cytochrome c oxidase subunit IV
MHAVLALKKTAVRRAICKTKTQSIHKEIYHKVWEVLQILSVLACRLDNGDVAGRCGGGILNPAENFPVV